MSEIELPEPVEHQYLVKDWRGAKVWADGIPQGEQHFGTRALYTAEQVRAAILAERERCAKLAEAWKVDSPNNWNQIGQTATAAGIAAAIRRGSV